METNGANLAEIEVTVVGKDFEPGPTANEAISRLLGHDANTLVLDFCEDTALACEHMEFQNRVPYIKPARGRRGFVCIFDHEGDVCVTKEFPKASHAVAAALHFTLLSNQKLSQS